MISDFGASVLGFFLEIVEMYPPNIYGVLLGFLILVGAVLLIYAVIALKKRGLSWLMGPIIFAMVIGAAMVEAGSVHGALKVLSDMGAAFGKIAALINFPLWGFWLGFSAFMIAMLLIYLLEQFKKWNAMTLVRLFACVGLIASIYILVNGLYWFGSWDPASPAAQQHMKNTMTWDDLFSLNMTSFFHAKDFLQDLVVTYWPSLSLLGGLIGIFYYGLSVARPKEA